MRASIEKTSFGGFLEYVTVLTRVPSSSKILLLPLLLDQSDAADHGDPLAALFHPQIKIIYVCRWIIHNWWLDKWKLIWEEWVQGNIFAQFVGADSKVHKFNKRSIHKMKWSIISAGRHVTYHLFKIESSRTFFKTRYFSSFNIKKNLKINLDNYRNKFLVTVKL